jgi:methylmalonyl-CoA mutase cobalamin-binding domain/chain
MDSTKQIAKNLLNDQAALLAEKIVELQYSKQAEFWKPYGSPGRKLSERDAAYHLPFLAEAVSMEDERIFTNYVKWVKKLFRGLNFPDDVMIMTLKCTDEIIRKEFPENVSSLVSRYIESGLIAMNESLETSETYIHKKDPLSELARDYNEALLSGNRKAASEMVISAVQNGVDVKDMYLYVFQKSQYEIGRLWLDNKITVAKEHFCSAATQQIMSQLYPYIFNSQRIGKTLVAANVGNELHEIGIRMVADFFEMEGWDTYYLGANTPTQTIIHAIEENKADVVGLSIAIPYHLSILMDSIKQIKKEFNGGVKILVGGYALNDLGDRWKELGADGYAKNAQEAISLANSLTGI